MKWRFRRRKNQLSPLEVNEEPHREITTSPITCSAKRTESPFLRLPPDVRILIYRYLVPTLDLGPYSHGFTPSQLRHDGEPCCPAILRTSRMIYSEAVHEWYGYISFTATWARHKTPTLCFLDQPTLATGVVPSIFRLITSLTLKVNLQRYQEQDSILLLQHQALLDTCFPPGRLGNLRKLTIDLFIRSPIYWGFKVDKDLLRRSIEQDLSHFKELQLPELHFKVRLGDHKDYLFEDYPPNRDVPSLAERKAEVTDIARNILRSWEG